MNENLPDMKHGLRFVVFAMCGLVNFKTFLPTRTPKINQTAHPAPHRANCQFFCLHGTSQSPEIAPNNRSRTPNQRGGYVILINMLFFSIPVLYNLYTSNKIIKLIWNEEVSVIFSH